MEKDIKIDLSPEQELFMKGMLMQSAKYLITTMRFLEIPNYMEVTVVSEGEKFVLRIEKQPPAIQ